MTTPRFARLITRTLTAAGLAGVLALGVPALGAAQDTAGGDVAQSSSTTGLRFGFDRGHGRIGNFVGWLAPRLDLTDRQEAQLRRIVRDAAPDSGNRGPGIRGEVWDGLVSILTPAQLERLATLEDEYTALGPLNALLGGEGDPTLATDAQRLGHAEHGRSAEGAR